jgi:cytoskeletal protein CcmA (bactofilin family)
MENIIFDRFERKLSQWTPTTLLIQHHCSVEMLTLRGRFTDGDIHIGSTGIVEADIKAINVIIEGTVTGNVFANEHLEIQSSGKMTGDITARSIDIQEGSTFEGRSHMIKSDQSKTIADPSLVASNSTTTDNE